MNETKPINKLVDRKKHKVRKCNAKKRETADSAIDALKMYGYARTTLRDIAARAQRILPQRKSSRLSTSLKNVT